MCGIAGFRARGDDDSVAATLMDALRHRGPDGSTWGTHGGSCLVQTRLAVIDLSDRVRYPMPSETGQVQLVFNGEIYNHLELRTELRRLGHRFATNCDAEVVVHGWEEWGERVFPRLSGMFAVAIADLRTDELILARDRFGIKPLFRTTGERFAFASDCLALVRAGLSAGAPDHAALTEFAAFHYVPHPHSGLADVRQIEPGTLLRRAADGPEAVRRWAPVPFSSPARLEPPTAAELDAALLRSVERHLRADVAVGVLLSGGVDSRLVLALAVAAGARPEAFTMSFAGHGDYDEQPAAEATATAFGVPHRAIRFELSFHQALESVASAYDTPFADASAIATLGVARLARENVTVVLTGTGGDDLFAGYSRHRAHMLLGWLRRLPSPLLRQLAGTRRVRGGERLSLIRVARSYAGRLAQTTDGDAFDQYLALVASQSTGAAAEVLGAAASPAAAGVAQRLGLRAPDHASVLRRLQAFECRTYLPGDLLTKEDRATMAVGLEGRVPLLDLELLGLAERTRDPQRATLRSGKRLLREVAAKRLMGAPRLGRKRGFAVPLDDLLRNEWRAPALAYLHNSGSTLFDGRAAAGAADRGDLAATDVWALSALAAWEARVRAARTTQVPAR